MENSIKDIEKWLPQGILQKGEDYYEDDLVDNLERDGKKWSADVDGSGAYAYMVEVDMKGEAVTSWFCDCPYDYGPVCKHVAAVLLSIQDVWTEEEKVTTPVFKKIRTQKTAANKKNSNPITTIIEKLEESELRRLLHYFAGRHDVVKSHLLSNYADLLDNVSKAHFKNLVSSFIKANTSGRGNFIEYRQASQLGHQLTNLLENDNSKLPMASVYLAEEVIAQTAKAIQHADDSSGSMGGAIAEGFLVLESFAEEENESPEEVVMYIFELAKKSMSLPVYQGWDWAGDFRSLTVTAARTKEDIETLLIAFDQHIASKKNEEGYSSKYDIEQTEKLKYQLIQKWYSTAEAEQYLQERLHFSSFRKMALEMAFANKEFDTVLALAEAGVILDTETKLPGLVKEWQRWLIKHAEATGNNAKLIELNEKMFLDRGEMDYYRKLKILMSPAAFKERVEKYIEHFRSKELSLIHI